MGKKIAKDQLLEMLDKCSQFLANNSSMHITGGKEEAVAKLNRLWNDADKILQQAHALGIVNRDRLMSDLTWRTKDNHHIVTDIDDRDFDLLHKDDSYYKRHQVIEVRGHRKESKSGGGYGRGIRGQESIVRNFQDAVRHVQNNTNLLLEGKPIPAKKSAQEGSNWEAAEPLQLAA